MSPEDTIGILVVIQIAYAGTFVHHLYQCRKVQRTLGRILQKLGMDDG
jgi:hypothetical protein